MKNTLLLVTIVSGFLLPAAMHADTPATKNKKTTKTAAQAPAVQRHETTYIAKEAPTGSHIPAVWRSYNGRMDTPSNLRVYGENDLNRAGQLDVASELTMVDTSITHR